MKTNKEHIDQLIERFFDGTTSKNDEKELYAFFKQEDIPENMLEFKVLFNYFDTGIKEELESGENEKQPARRGLGKKLAIWTSAVASLFVIAFAVNFFFTGRLSPTPSEQIYVTYNGKKITDKRIIDAEISAVLKHILDMETEIEALLSDGIKSEKPINRNDEEDLWTRLQELSVLIGSGEELN